MHFFGKKIIIRTLSLWFNFKYCGALGAKHYHLDLKQILVR